MQIVIEIDEDAYKEIKKIVADGNEMCFMQKLIANGTPLPKGHGRIIDESQVTGTFIWDNRYIECYAPTIIEADEAERSDNE